jgi:hypothetical protein
MITQNSSLRKGWINNACGIVCNLRRRFVEVQVIDNCTNALSELHCIPRIRFEFEPSNSNWTVLQL